MVDKLATPEGQKIFSAHKWLSEDPNGWIKQVMGFRSFSLRGLEKAQGEWDLVCLSLKVKRLRILMAGKVERVSRNSAAYRVSHTSMGNFNLAWRYHFLSAIGACRV